jgi:hypothetical protein
MKVRVPSRRPAAHALSASLCALAALAGGCGFGDDEAVRPPPSEDAGAPRYVANGNVVNVTLPEGSREALEAGHLRSACGPENGVRSVTYAPLEQTRPALIATVVCERDVRGEPGA